MRNAWIVLVCAFSYCLGAIDHCQTYQQDNPNLCAKCESGYGLSLAKDACMKCPENCIECLQTESGYTSCTTCLSGFFAFKYGNKPNAYCYECPQGCSDCRNFVGCFKCNPNYYIYNDIYPIVGQQCRVCDSHCTDCQDIKGCVKCQAGYFAQRLDRSSSDRKCSECDSNCKTCEDDAGCTVCKDGYYNNFLPSKQALICEKCKDGCLLCDGGTYHCQRCDEGYFMQDANCYKCDIDNCKSCSRISPCMECKDGFDLVVEHQVNFKCEKHDAIRSTIKVIVVVVVICMILGGLIWYLRWLSKKKADEKGLLSAMVDD